jgi:hypothetical protein
VRRAALGAIVLAVAVAGCAETADPLSREDYVREVDRLCAAGVERNDRLIEDAFAELYGGGPPANPSAANLQELYSRILPAARRAAEAFEEMLDDLRALDAPAALAAEADDLWAAYDERLDGSVRRIEEAAADPAKAVELDLDDAFPFDPENERAAALGFTACAFE